MTDIWLIINTWLLILIHVGLFITTDSWLNINTWTLILIHLGLFITQVFFISFKRRVTKHNMDRVKRIWYLSHMRAAKVQASLRIRAVSPEPPLLAQTSSESRGTFRQKARSLAPLNGWACAVKICHDGMLEDTNSLDGAHILNTIAYSTNIRWHTKD